MRRPVALVGALALPPPAGLSAFAFVDRYWRWRTCFAENGNGRCFGCDGPGLDECHVYLEQAGAVWGGLALLFAAAAVAPLAVVLRPRRAGGR